MLTGQLGRGVNFRTATVPFKQTGVLFIKHETLREAITLDQKGLGAGQASPGNW